MALVINLTPQKTLIPVIMASNPPIMDTPNLPDPTAHSYLLGHYDSMSPADQASARRSAAALRLAVSGSSACPIPVMNRWKELTGKYLLER